MLPNTVPCDVRIEIFTTAFRKVQDQTFPHVPAGGKVALELKDKWGHPLASGLYYVVVSFQGHKMVEKLLVLR